MTQTIYDPETPEQSQSPHSTPTHPDSTSSLKQAEQNPNDTSASSSSEPKSFYNPNNSDEQNEGQSLYNPKDTKRNKIKGKIKSLGKKKWLLAGGGGAFIIIAAIIAFFLILAASLRIPNLAQNITTYQFARLTRQYSKTSALTNEEELALEETPTGVYSSLKDFFSSIHDNTFGLLDQYRPSKILNNLGDTNGLKFNFTTSKLSSREILQSMEIDGQTIMKEQVTGITKWLPIVRTIKDTQYQMDFQQNALKAIDQAMYNNQVNSFQSAVASGYDQSIRSMLNTPSISQLDIGLQTDNLGLIIRGGIASKLRSLSGSNLAGFVLNAFKKDEGNPEAAVLESTRQNVQAVNDASQISDPALSSSINNDVNQTEQAAQTTLNNDVQLQNTIDNKGISSLIVNSIKKAANTSLVSKTVSFINPLYAVAMPLCMVFDGSVQSSGPTIANQMNQQQAAYYHLVSIADQQKNGSIQGKPNQSSELATAVQAENTNLGNTTASNAEIRAGGGTVNTTTSPSPEAGASGAYYYSLLNVLGVSAQNPVGQAANYIVGHTCSVLTNVWVGATLGLANIVGALFSGGETQIVENGLKETVVSGVKKIIGDITDKIFASTITDGIKTTDLSFVARLINAKSVVGKFVAKQALVVGSIVGATILARTIVAARAGQMNSGLAQGKTLANIADSGGNIVANELERQQLFGRPLLNGELVQSNQASKNFIAYTNSKKSFSKRFFSTNNPNSLISHMAIDMASIVKPTIMVNLFKFSSSIFQPLKYFGMLVGVAHAAPNPSTQYYGNVQFGWSQQEENIITSNSSYLPIENQAILNAANPINGQPAKDAIASKYAVCFGYQYNSSGNGSMNPTISGSDMQLDSGPGQPGNVGSLLAAGPNGIVRDNNGNIIANQGLCSPQNLGINNSSYGPQMVFRWRLAMRYDTTIHQLTALQQVTKG